MRDLILFELAKGRPYLNTVVAGRNPAALDLHVGGGMGELALAVRPGALLSLVLAADLQLQPTGILLVQHRVHVQHGDRGRAQVAREGHDGGRGHGLGWGQGGDDRSTQVM